MDNKTIQKKTKERGNVCLPAESNIFLDNVSIKEQNLYLSQNRFCYKHFDEKQVKSPDFKYEPLLLKIVRERPLKDTDVAKAGFGKIMHRLKTRNSELAKSYPSYDVYPFKPYDKLIIGEGGAAYLEVQPLRLHQLYGVPFIPASALKGTLRNTWILEEFNGNEKRAEENDNFVRLFGGKGKDSKMIEGSFTFFDTYPEQFEIGLDVQTNHYQDYYMRDKEPTDDQDTLPILFMCLRKSSFRIFIAGRHKEIWEQNKDKLDQMVRIMFTQYGIGAKTALGYGTE